MVADGDVSVGVGAEIAVSGGSVVFGVPLDRLWFRRSSDWLSSINSTLCSASVMSVGVGGGRVVVSVVFLSLAEAPLVNVIGDGVVAAVGTSAVAVSGFDISFVLLLLLLLLLLFLFLLLLPFQVTTVVVFFVFFFVVVGVAVAVAAAIATITGEVVYFCLLFVLLLLFLL